MLPTLRPGDELEFVPPIGSFAPGDIVLWHREHRFFVHRVVRQTESGIVAQGDALLMPDPLVDLADVLGKLESYERGGRRRLPGYPGALDRCYGWVLRRSGAATRLFLRWHHLTRSTLRQVIGNADLASQSDLD